MSWEAYHREIIKAKEEYDRSIEPIVKRLQRTKKQAWNRYLAKITEAEIFLKEDLR